MKHLVCYSGGHSSALVAVEVVRRYGKDDVILLNHDINPSIEDADIKRFKTEVAAYLGIPITYVNHPQWDTADQFSVCISAKAFKVRNGSALCTNRLKTAPFDKYLETVFPDKDVVIYYGFDGNELTRIQRRSTILGSRGYKTDFPLALWQNRTILDISEIGISPPGTYGMFKHANCTGCLKAGKQHWYIVYLNRPDIWESAKHAEDEIGYSILSTGYLHDLEKSFNKMRDLGITTSEHEDARTFFARVKKLMGELVVNDPDVLPCECVF